MRFDDLFSVRPKPIPSGSPFDDKTPHCGVAWMFLAAAIVSEVGGLTLMKISVLAGRAEGFIALYVLIALSYVFLAKAVKSISIGVAYAIWEGSGVALISIISAFLFRQPLSVLELVGLTMAVIGIWMIQAGENDHA
jgi:spermidine export protein MdtJ